MNYSSRKTYKRTGRNWTLTDTRTDNDFIIKMLATDLFYSRCKSVYIRKIRLQQNTMTVWYDNGYKAVYEK